MVARLEATVVRLTEALAERGDRIAERDARIGELERLLEESRRAGKRQAAPFRKGEPVDDPKRSGRRSGGMHGRHGHRLAPVGADRHLDALLPPACPRCGGELEHDRDADQFETDLPILGPPTVTRFRV
jgi:transposase